MNDGARAVIDDYVTFAALILDNEARGSRGIGGFGGCTNIGTSRPQLVFRPVYLIAQCLRHVKVRLVWHPRISKY